MSNLLLPTQIKDLNSILRALDWRVLSREVDQEAHLRLAIVGPVNSGKSTLFNRLHGRTVSAASAVPGTTQNVVEHALGPFLLVDTPGFGEVWGVDRAAIAQSAAAAADLVLLVLDAAAGVRQSDHDLFQNLRTLGHPVIVTLNKTDLVKKDLPWVLENAEALLGLRPIPISARTGMGITDKLLPTILQVQPGIAVAMARGLPAVRKQLVNRLIRQTAFTNAVIALEPLPGLDIPLLLASQTRMVLRIAAAYGQPMSVTHARELLSTIAGGLLARYLAEQLAKLFPGPGWIVSAAIAAMGTWAIGQAARRYFEAGANIPGPDLRALYQSFRKRAARGILNRQPLEIPVAEESEEADFTTAPE